MMLSSPSVTAMITGASSGIGLETARILARQGISLILLCREEEAHTREMILRENAGHIQIHQFTCDLSSQTQIRSTCAKIQDRFSAIDILINNAGCNFSQQVLSEDGIEMQFAVNYLAPFLLTRLMLPQIRRAPQGRILNISSRAHRTGRIHLDNLNLDNRYSAMSAYSQSKLAVVLFTYELARKLQGTATTVNCMHPGLVNTRIGNKHATPAHDLFWRILKVFGRPPARAAEELSHLATAEALCQTTGTYFAGTRPIKSARQSYDTDLARELWAISTRLSHSEDLPL